MTINITKEAMKAETKLRHIRANAERAVLAVRSAWLGREITYVSSLPKSVRAVLVAAGALPAGAEPAPELQTVAAEEYVELGDLLEEEPETMTEVMS